MAMAWVGWSWLYLLQKSIRLMSRKAFAWLAVTTSVLLEALAGMECVASQFADASFCRQATNACAPELPNKFIQAGAWPALKRDTVPSCADNGNDVFA
jgi:hypothetical protein